MVRLMFTLDKKTETRDGFELEFSAVIGNTKESETFFKYTPYGNLKFGTVNEAAAAPFKAGERYYLDISPAKETETK